jgi:hydrogenase nickel insertion protein HypA
MHELSLILSIFDVIKNEIKKHKYKKINTVELEVGDYLNAINESLITCFDAAKSEVAETKDAQLIIFNKTTTVQCNICKSKWDFKNNWFFCKDCNVADSEFIAGKEFKIIALEVEN